MSISEQVKELREIANRLGMGYNVAIFEGVDKFRQAADTIESLSAKLQAENMERSADGSGWIPCSERLPEENQNVIACFAHGTVTELAFYDGKFHGMYSYDKKVITAWQPLPEPYREENGKYAKSSAI